jgi:pimeloyl-ACP methyl ester carboxylesterase
MLDHARTDGVDLHYQTVGEGPPLVLLHGFSGNHLSWWRQFPVFADDYRCIAPDQRRFGLSADEPDGPGVAAFVDDLTALLDGLGHDRVALVGHSMSGWPAVSFATQHPDRVAALVLSGTPGGLVSPERHERLREEAADSLSEVDPLSEELAFLSESVTELNRHAPAAFEDVHPVLERLPADADTIVEADIPAFLVAGAADPFMPEPAVAAVSDALDGAEFAIVEGAAHSANFEQPERFNRHVGSFLDAHAEF